MTQYHNIILR